MFPMWPAFLVIGAFVLQAVVGFGLIFAGAIMASGRRGLPPPDGRWPLSQKLIVIGAMTVVLAVLEFVSVCAVTFVFLNNVRFA